MAIQRYATHPAPRLVSVGQSRQDEVLLHQQQQHSALVQQAVSPEGTVFYQHSPSASDVHASDDGGGEITTVSSRKYANECQTNGHGHDSLSDFVTFVCQETEQSGTNQNHRNSPKSQQYSQYNTLPPMLPPLGDFFVISAGNGKLKDTDRKRNSCCFTFLAIPVPLRMGSSDLAMVNPNSPPISPQTSSPHQKLHMGHTDVNQSPPLSPQSQMDRKALTRITSPYSNGRDYTFNHFHTQQPQVTT